MRFTLRHFYLHKQGNRSNDYEDAFSPQEGGSKDQETFALAIADGATETSFANYWAKILVKNFVKSPFFTKEVLQDRIKTLADRWQKKVNREQLQWYAEEKLRLGAFSTFLGIEFKSNHHSSHISGSWSAIAIGDSCLFQVRNDNLIESFPISNIQEFGNRPILLSSNPASNSEVWQNVRLRTSKWKSGDVFLLATDALACWFLKEHELNAHPWNILLGISEDPNPSQSFRRWANELRKSSKMRNDDVTLLLVKL